jgi:DNA-binding response OmpR family regulator
MANETILIVDDSAEIISFLRRNTLQPLGYQVLTALDGRAGLEMALEHNPDLILLDMSMPQLTGMEMLRALRQTLCTSPVIFMTMFGSESIAVEAFRLGVRDYLPKPFTVEEVQEAVERALREARLAQERDELLRELVSAETVRRTVVTLAHYINNDLFIANGGLTVLLNALDEGKMEPTRLRKVVDDSQTSLVRIGAVMRVLQRVVNAVPATYHGEVKMIDIEQALKEELGRG